MKYLKEVVGTFQNGRLHVVATVCNMDANNVKALKELGATREKPFFKIENQEIVTINDPLT
jgi:hypothetical protein